MCAHNNIRLIICLKRVWFYPQQEINRYGEKKRLEEKREGKEGRKEREKTGRGDKRRKRWGGRKRGKMFHGA